MITARNLDRFREAERESNTAISELLTSTQPVSSVRTTAPQTTKQVSAPQTTKRESGSKTTAPNNETTKAQAEYLPELSEQLFAEINSYRKNNGLPPFQSTPNLVELAKWRAFNLLPARKGSLETTLIVKKYDKEPTATQIMEDWRKRDYSYIDNDTIEKAAVAVYYCKGYYAAYISRIEKF